ncbi:MAG: DMT family transporter [Rubrivivax sp.]
MTHRRAVLLMICVTLMWSIAGIVTRHLDRAQGFELTFWRSLFNALALLLMLGWLRGPALLWRQLRYGGRPLWISGFCWSVMFTAFMVALTLTEVANVLVTMALAPLFTALAAWLALNHRLAARTWLAIAAAGSGIVWMYAGQLAGSNERHWIDIAMTLCVPMAAAVNWTLLQHLYRPRPTTALSAAPAPDMLSPVLLGALISAAFTGPLSLPLAASAHDVALLGLLGVFQLAIPCLLAVRVSRVLSAPELSLLSLLEVVFGVAWVWLGSSEAPTPAVVGGGALVLGALLFNELLTLRGGGWVGAARQPANPTPIVSSTHPTHLQ